MKFNWRLALTFLMLAIAGIFLIISLCLILENKCLESMFSAFAAGLSFGIVGGLIE